MSNAGAGGRRQFAWAMTDSSGVRKETTSPRGPKHGEPEVTANVPCCYRRFQYAVSSPMEEERGEYTGPHSEEACQVLLGSTFIGSDAYGLPQ
mmetsp:Transcript_39240/g.70388  ORF Transcript_39240/g.70388 Transcript_39240/m.70388 type:complete len:93 (+) Transcript_39240:1629-1907(+)